MPEPPRFDPDLEWLDLVRPVGLVVAPSLLKELGLTPQLQTRADNAAVGELLRPEDEEGPALSDAWSFSERILGWPKARVAGAPGGPSLPEDLCKVLPEYDTVLEPHWAVAGLDGGWQLLVRVEAPGIKPDARGALAGWEATPHQRFERLLREMQVPIGILITDQEFRLVYAPSRETSGWIAFPLRPLATVAGRPMLGGLKLVLDSFRLFNDGENRRLPALLKASRDAQTTVSATLAEQVVGALHELLRGLTATEPKLIGTLATERPQHLYEGLLTVLMRLVFILYAEDRDLIPSRTDEKARALYEQGYSVRGLDAKLLDDQARYPDTMEDRRGAWGRLIALFRLIHAGDRTGWILARGGKLFNPDAFPFLEGRASPAEPPRIVSVTDGSVLRILDGLLTLKGERLSYRTLDVEQIGSVYETVMGFTVLTASGPVLAIRAGKDNRTPVFVDLAGLAALRSEERLKRLKEGALRSSLTERQQQEIRAAAGIEGMAAALDSIVDERGSPDKRVVSAGTPILQPTAERRNTQSHYTPRTLTEPIVRYALEPVLERLGPDARPEEFLDLKICDPAMGSGAFLVEACRALAARLVQAWARRPETRPKLPPDEDEDLHARRLVAQRCLYGVDKNPMATDLVKLSLWLATLARDHEFTFLDHALKSGDSLVGLTRAQIGALHWDASRPGLPLFSDLIRERFDAALTGRKEIRNAPDDVERAIQEARYQRVEQRLSDARLLGNAVIAAFFSADKPRAREAKRQEIESWLNEPPAAIWPKVRELADGLRHNEKPLLPFHWEMEFPEVFDRKNPGFDVIVGNPPFAGKNNTIKGNIFGFLDWLQELHEGSHGNSDLVAHFFRRSYTILRSGGCIGLVATTRIGEGDTRTTGLSRICEQGGEIFNASPPASWPGAAAVQFRSVHLIKGPTATPRYLNGKRVDRIGANLLSVPLSDVSAKINDGLPVELVHSWGISYVGHAPHGAGFILSDTEARQLLLNERNAEVIAPFLIATDLNESPTLQPSRWIIDFGNKELAECEKYRHCLDIVRERVKPYRQTNNRKAYREKWWLFGERRSALATACARSSAIVACAMTTMEFKFAWVPTTYVFDQTLAIVEPTHPGCFAILESSVHKLWAVRAGASFGSSGAPRYNPSRCFRTFPFPTGGVDMQRLVKAETAFVDHRQQVMSAHQMGLTQIYNRFNDPGERALDILKLRELHAAMDCIVLYAYDWEDLVDRAAPQFLDETNEDDHKYQGRLFWPAEFRDQVLARLLALNAERAAAEREDEALAPRARAKRTRRGSVETELLESVAADEDD